MPRITEALESQYVVYVPDVDDNREDCDPMTVELRPMNARELRAIRGKLKPKGKKFDEMEYGQRMIDTVVSDCVRSVSGYRVFGQDVTDGAGLVEYGEDEVLIDVYNAITKASVLSEGLKGN